VARLHATTLVAGPAEVRERGRRARDAIDLLPRVPAHVADPEVIRARPDREAEGIPETLGDDAAGGGVRPANRVTAGRCAGDRVETENRTVEARRIRVRAQV